MLYGLDDVCIIPAKISYINSRSECRVVDVNDTLPIFVAPMSCLVNYENYPNITRLRVLDLYDKEGKTITARINAILPRSVNLSDRVKSLESGNWVAFSLAEADRIAQGEIEITPREDKHTFRICIDMANGHMKEILNVCRKLKSFFKKRMLFVDLMVGNIANPETYKEFCNSGDIDYVRLGIGSGNVCTTSVQSGVHYPMASLIAECHKIRCNVDAGKAFLAPKIVADGGFQRIDQCVKALALGADYVMLGKIIAKSDEACGKEFRKAYYGVLKSPQYILKEDADQIEKNEILRKQAGITPTLYTESEVPAFMDPEIFREYYGMSTQRAQKEFNPDATELKHSEGLESYVKVEYSLTDWLSDFAHAFRTAMSYAGSISLDEFIWNTKCGLMSKSDFNSYMYKVL